MTGRVGFSAKVGARDGETPAGRTPRVDVLALSAATRHTKHDAPLTTELRAFAKCFTSTPYEATAIDYDPDARRFRVTFPREVLRRLVRANRLVGTWTMQSGTACQVVYQAERKSDHG